MYESQPIQYREEKMPKKEGGWGYYIILVILFILLLKAFKVLPDPPDYIEIFASIGASVGIVASFGLLFNHIIKFEHRLTSVENDLKTIKMKLGA